LLPIQLRWASSAEASPAQSTLKRLLEAENHAREILKAAAENAEATTAKAREQNFDHTQITAPVDGTVVSRNMDVGQTVAASFQAPVIFLISQDLTKMLDTNVDESDVGPIRVGQTAHDGFQPRAQSLSQLGAQHDPDRDRSALAG
jgi:multidrug resistance efflux pump